MSMEGPAGWSRGRPALANASERLFHVDAGDGEPDDIIFLEGGNLFAEVLLMLGSQAVTLGFLRLVDASNCCGVEPVP